MNLLQTTFDDGEYDLTVTLTDEGRLWIGRGRHRLGGLFTNEAKRPGDCPARMLRTVSVTRGTDPVRATTFSIGWTDQRLRWIEWADGSTSWDVAPKLAAVGGAGARRR